MEGERKTQLETLLLTHFLENQSKNNPSKSLVGLIDGLHPLIKISAPIMGAFLWFQTNFATTQMYQAHEKKILETNIRLDNQYKEVKQLIDQRHQESLSHSNDNRDRMMAVMSEIKDSLKTLYLDRQVKR